MSKLRDALEPFGLDDAPIDTLVLLAPNARRASTAAARDSGIAVRVIALALRLVRKSNTTTTTRTPPSRSALTTFCTATSMKSA